ncbi:amino acid permease [Candidatus Uhrbacteria bacterium]|nr:amino acid permease [Candidatus Uhrbacteria bacterium]
MATAAPTTQHYSRSIAMLIGTIIGVGIFGVPYVVAQSGIPIGLLLFGVLTLVVLLVHLFFGELTLRTEEHHRLVGYAGKYFGRWGKAIAGCSAVFGMYGALLAYLLVSGEFLEALAGPVLGGDRWWYSVGFGALGLLAVAVGLRLIEELEFILTAFLLVAMTLICIVGGQRISGANLTMYDVSHAFVPYGAILFALSGVSAIAEIRELLRGREKRLAPAIAWGTILAALMSVAFVVTVVGVSGDGTTPEAISGLEPVLGRSIVILGGILGFLAIATSFLMLGLYLRDVFELDFGLPKRAAVLAALGVPFGIFLLGDPNFTTVILITGALFNGIDGILIALLILRARKYGNRKPEFQVRLPAVVNWVVVAVFVAGMVVTIRAIAINVVEAYW